MISVLRMMIRSFQLRSWRRLNGPQDDRATLVVIDMQPYFSASQNESTIGAVERQILRAIACRRPILIVEYEDCGETDRRLMRHLEGKYELYQVVPKRSTDGSQEVARACRWMGFPRQHFQVCGVNTDACVRATVSGLAYRLPGALVEVIKEACNTEGLPNWDYFHTLPKVVLSNEKAVRV
jgi:nicotinamidase-related amidase